MKMKFIIFFWIIITGVLFLINFSLFDLYCLYLVHILLEYKIQFYIEFVIGCVRVSVFV